VVRSGLNTYIYVIKIEDMIIIIESVLMLAVVVGIIMNVVMFIKSKYN